MTKFLFFFTSGPTWKETAYTSNLREPKFNNKDYDDDGNLCQFKL